MNFMNRSLALLGLVSLLSTGSLLAETPQEKGYKIAEQIEARPAVQRSITESEFEIYNNQGELVFTKKFRSASFVADYQDPKKRLSRGITYFYAPADDKVNAALQIEHPGSEENDQWIYLKGLRKPKRVLGSDKSSSFMGSDFSNGDLDQPDLEDSTYTWAGQEEYDFRGKKLKLEKLEIVFKDKQMREDYGTSKAVTWVHPQSGLMFKGEFYDLQGQLEKTATLLSFQTVKNRDGKTVFTATGLEMKNQIKGTKTIMKVGKLLVEDQAKQVKEDMFTLSQLTRRWW